MFLLDVCPKNPVIVASNRLEINALISESELDSDTDKLTNSQKPRKTQSGTGSLTGSQALGPKKKGYSRYIFQFLDVFIYKFCSGIEFGSALWRDYAAKFNALF